MLLANLSDNVVVSKQTGKIRDKDRTWDSVKKSLLGNINGFLEELKVSYDAPCMVAMGEFRVRWGMSPRDRSFPGKVQLRSPW